MNIDARTIIRNIIVALVGIGLVVLVIVLLIKSVSSGPATPVNRVDVGKFAYDPSIATLFVDGPTNLDQDHYQVRISVSGTQNEVDILQGYQGNVIKTQRYTNNTAAYGAFLQSLQRLGFSKGVKSTVDYRGFCPSGERYTYSFTNGQDELFSYWSTSCGGQGTFQGIPSSVRALFKAQTVPNDLTSLTTGTNVSF